MPNIQDWISQRLKKIPPGQFVNKVGHRVPKSKKSNQFQHEYYAVPLSAGCGTAILTVSKALLEASTFPPLVLFFHGLGQDSTSPYWHLIYDLAASGIAVLSIDWDGHGSGASSLLDLQEATRSIPLLIQRLYGEQHGVGLNAEREGPRCYLMGHSFGASLSLIAVTRDDVQQHVYGVIAVSPTLSIQSFFGIVKESIAFLKPSAWFSDFANKLGLYGMMGLIPSFGTFKRKQHPLRMKLDIDYVEQARQFVYETFENRRILKKVKTPVLWFHGQKDTVCPYYQACQLMLEMKSAFFSVCDDDRGHLRMIFSDKVTSSSIKFIRNNSEFYRSSN